LGAPGGRIAKLKLKVRIPARREGKTKIKDGKTARRIESSAQKWYAGERVLFAGAAPMRKLLESLRRQIAEMPWSESECAYHATLQERPKRNDDEFFDEFYAATSIPRDIPIRLRKLYEEIIGVEFSALRPEDNHAIIYDELDFADVLYRVGREFSLNIPIETVLKSPLTYRGRASHQGEIDGTFEPVVRYLAKARYSSDSANSEGRKK
jgi:hypothetical protein